ncbi:MAG TPA: FhaA domain-containing protein [Blastocatellia bacterium]|nr:FhaA domain-containing protein [Blastocatellia bacterium]
MGVRERLETLRKWIDGEEDLDEQGEVRPRSKWDDFLVAIAREVEQAMKREMFTPPGGPTYIPREYVVFLNPEDDAEWQGEKREGLERGLRYVLSERAKDLAGENQFQTRTLTVELRVDAGLERGKFRVQHVWDTEAQKTMVTPRKRAESVPAAAPSAPVPSSNESLDEATVVRPRKSSDAASTEPVFSVIVRRNVPGAVTSVADVRPYFTDEITIGRGSRQVKVDLQLTADMEVSRKHATLTRNGDGTFTIACHGANPVVLESGREVTVNETANVAPGEKFVICSYELAVQMNREGRE